MKVTKKAITIAMLRSGRDGNTGTVYSPKEIVDRVNEVFPGGKGISIDCVYYYASKEGIALNRSNKAVNKNAYTALMEELKGGPVQGPVPTLPRVDSDEDPEPGAPAPLEVDRQLTLEELRAQIQAEVDAEFAERAEALAKAEAELEAKQAQIKVVKRANRK